MAKKTTFTQEEVSQIEKLIEQKIQSNSDKQKGKRQKIRNLGFYASDYGISGGYNVGDFRRVVSINGNTPSIPIVKGEQEAVKEKSASLRNDEAYIIDLCDEVLFRKALRQHKFDFLRGHTGRSLPVDAYYLKFKLVVEYHERQHTEEVGFFNKRITSTGINRGEQRKQYDNLRRTEIPKNDMQLIIFDYSDFKHNNSKRLIRNREDDIEVIKAKFTHLLI